MRLGCFLLLLIALMPSGLMAEELDTPQDKTSTQAPSMEATQTHLKSTEKPVQSSSTPKAQPTEREFDPSEDISEDLSVPFPVDI